MGDWSCTGGEATLPFLSLISGSSELFDAIKTELGPDDCVEGKANMVDETLEPGGTCTGAALVGTDPTRGDTKAEDEPDADINGSNPPKADDAVLTGSITENVASLLESDEKMPNGSTSAVFDC